MPIQAICPECGTQYSVPDTAAGRKVKCRTCQRVFPVPGEKRPKSAPAKVRGPKDPWESGDSSEEDIPLLTPARKSKPDDGLPPRIVKPKKTSTYVASDDDEDDEPRSGKKKPKQRSFDDTDPRLTILAIVLGLLVLAGLAVFFSLKDRPGADLIARAFNRAQEDDIEGTEDPDEIPLLDAARPFVEAIAARKYDAAFARLSPLALANAYRDQFIPAEETEQQRTSVSPLTVEKFKELMTEAETVLGAPKELDRLSVESSDPELLSGKGDPIERLFVLGGTPEAIPQSVRRASLRAQVIVKHPDFPDDAAEDEDLYLTMRIILTEEDGKLAVGYFELSPPSILD